MQIERHTCLVCLLLLVIAPNCLAQALDAQQIGLIQQAAASICDTVKDAKGSKTNVEIKGEIEAKLKGLAAKFASVGASGQGAFKDESFVGLSQDATAAALEGDRGCRERVFNKMFDRIESPKDKKAAYQPTTKIVQWQKNYPVMGTRDLRELRKISCPCLVFHETPPPDWPQGKSLLFKIENSCNVGVGVLFLKEDANLANANQVDMYFLTERPGRWFSFVQLRPGDFGQADFTGSRGGGAIPVSCT
jgi:hypothetical protein